ncbi:hypothetical protein HHK36_002797 [Tetracentron sinense]|uniref:Nuclear matrix constituent protein 1-like protein n=1 Tax=Tetracentron sinense TaxID=13715 RepID=A0A834ZX60_TETSI|nr:hypothetical protein HHK36_002797 [Tetracentron sinense]
MVSPRQEGSVIRLDSCMVRSPGSGVLENSTPFLRNSASLLSDGTIWKRLREAGFDEESIKRRDKAALIGYIAKLESEIFEYQHHMGLLILEKKEWASKYEQVKASAGSTEITYKLDQAAHSSALADARKREESLKKALGIEKECITNIEKALHEMRAESAEMKIAAESKMAEARSMVEDTRKKFTEAEAKLRAAESLQEEANRYHRAAERKLQEVEAREDELRRRLTSFNSDCDAKEKEIILEKQSLCERQDFLRQEQERLLEGQARLNQREEYIFGRSRELNRLEKELEESKAKMEKELRALNEEKSNLNLNIASISEQEEAVIKREQLLNKKEQELLILQEKLASKEYDEIQRLMADHEAVLKARKSEFDAELEFKRKLMEDEMEAKRRDCELREVDLNHREESVLEREHDLEVQSGALVDKERDTIERLRSLEEKHKCLNAAEKEAELAKMHLQKEREEINNMKLDLQKSMNSLDDKRKQVEQAQEKLEAMKSERDELRVLEMKLKEEIDAIRAQKLGLIAQADELEAEKAKFETEWELIDEKREELRKETECVAKRRIDVSKFLKDERDSLKLEKDALRDQFKGDVESLSCEREAFVSRMEHEHSEWFSKIQQERADLLIDIEMQKRELENCIDKRREEIEIYLREREEAFEQEKTKELQHINSLKEMTAKELEHVTLEMKRLDNERIEINLDRERRETEWNELKKFIEELQIQREKLKEQRELLHADREEIHVQIQHLNKLEDVKIASENIALSKMHQVELKPRRQKIPTNKRFKPKTIIKDAELDLHQLKEVVGDGLGLGLLSKHKGLDNASPPSSVPFSWIKRCAKLIFKHSPENSPMNYGERSLISEFQDENLKSLANKYPGNDKKVVSVQLENAQDTSSIFERHRTRGTDETDRMQPVTSVLEEPKVILEVPAVGEDVNGPHNVESKTNASENSAPSFSEQGFLTGRKRLKNSSSHDHVDAQLEQKRYNKKRRQHKDATETPLEEITTNCAFSTQPLAPEDEHGLMSFNQNPGDAEETSFYIDKSQNVPNLTVENEGTKTFADQTKLVCSQNSILDQESLQGGGSNGHADSPWVGNGASSHGSKAQENVLLLEVDEELARECSRDGIVAEKSSHKLKDHGKSKPGNSRKVEENDEQMSVKQK